MQRLIRRTSLSAILCILSGLLLISCFAGLMLGTLALGPADVLGALMGVGVRPTFIRTLSGICVFPGLSCPLLWGWDLPFRGR